MAAFSNVLPPQHIMERCVRGHFVLRDDAVLLHLKPQRDAVLVHARQTRSRTG